MIIQGERSKAIPFRPKEHSEISCYFLAFFRLKRKSIPFLYGFHFDQPEMNNVIIYYISQALRAIGLIELAALVF